jgi:TATA-box binding protein (TBP) (component of TFIID and TFIIIB)
MLCLTLLAVRANLGSQVLLGQLALALDERWEASYKPEVFPGCTMKLNDDTVVTIFARSVGGG